MGEQSWVDAHGVEVSSRWWPVDSPRAIVVIAHGASDHSGRYERFAGALNDAGFAVVAVDHRGHGRTGSSTGAGLMGPGGGRAVIDDLHELRSTARSTFGEDLPVYLFGHSMGSIVALAYLTEHSQGVSAAVVCGVPTDVNDPGGLAETLRELADAGMRDEPVPDLFGEFNVPFAPARTPFDWLSRDPAEVDRYVEDPFCGNQNPLTIGYIIDLSDALSPSREHLNAISCPVLVIAGDEDPAGANGAHPTALAAALRAVGVPTELILYEGGRHEILNETNRDQVTADVVEFFRSHR